MCQALSAEVRRLTSEVRAQALLNLRLEDFVEALGELWASETTLQTLSMGRFRIWSSGSESVGIQVWIWGVSV